MGRAASPRAVTFPALAASPIRAALPAAAQDEWVGQVTSCVRAACASGSQSPFPGPPALSCDRS